jgi:hypothetical protein
MGMSRPLPEPYERLIAASERVYGGSSKVERVVTDHDPGKGGVPHIGGGATHATYNATTRTLAVSPQTHERLTAAFENRLLDGTESSVVIYRVLHRLAKDLLIFHHEATHSFVTGQSEAMLMNDRRRLSDEGMTHNATLTTLPDWLNEVGMKPEVRKVLLTHVPTVGIYDKEVAANKLIMNRLAVLTGSSQPAMVKMIVANGRITNESIPAIAAAIMSHSRVFPSEGEIRDFESALQYALVDPMGDFITLNPDGPDSFAVKLQQGIDRGVRIGRDSGDLVGAVTDSLIQRVAQRSPQSARPSGDTPAVVRETLKSLDDKMMANHGEAKVALEVARFRRDFTFDPKETRQAYDKARAVATKSGDTPILQQVEKDVLRAEHPYMPDRIAGAHARSLASRAVQRGQVAAPAL